MLQQGKCLFVTPCIGDKGYLKPHYLHDLVEVNLREYYLLSNPEGVIPATIKLAVNALEVSYAGQSHRYQPLKKLIHPLLAQCNHHANWHILP